MPTGDAATLFTVMSAHRWFIVYGLVEAAAGLMLLVGRLVPLALTLLAGVGVNILLFVGTLTPGPSALAMPLFLAVLEILLVYAYRESFAGIFRARTEPALR
ncbi:MAG TPA: DoxX family protein [Acidobacteriaceae bacterium]|nr:DoxX family protein [Acidobacteriaceae bacterium]